MNFPPLLWPQEPETVLLRRTKAALHPAGSFRLSSLLTRSRKALPRLCRASNVLLPRGTASVYTRPWTEWQPWQTRERGMSARIPKKTSPRLSCKWSPRQFRTHAETPTAGRWRVRRLGGQDSRAAIAAQMASFCIKFEGMEKQRHGQAAKQERHMEQRQIAALGRRRLSTEVFQNRPTPGKQNLPLLRALPVFYRFRGAHEGDRREKNRYLSFTHVKLASPGPAGERQEHLHSITAFLGTGQRRLLFRALDTFTVRWETERSCFLRVPVERATDDLDKGT